MLRKIIASRTDGVIFLGRPTGLENEYHLDELAKAKIPVVLTNRRFENQPFPLVYPDYHKAGAMAAAHLIQRGCKRIAVATKNVDTAETSEQISGFQTELERHGMQIPVQCFFSYDDGLYFVDSVYEQIRQKKVDAVFAVNELIAVYLIKELGVRGVRIPDDVAVLGFGNTVLGRLVTPMLTCLDLQNTDIGVNSARVLLKMLRNQPVEKATILEPILLVRQSA